jgi:hypothetical protein
MRRNPFPQLNRFKTPHEFRRRLEALEIELPLDAHILSATEGSPLAQPIEIFGCYPLDPYYKDFPEAEAVKRLRVY